jgi:GcrA cell cycle regulator
LSAGACAGTFICGEALEVVAVVGAGSPAPAPDAPKAWDAMTKDERVAAVNAGRLAGFSSTHIARLYRAVSRNVIIGFCHRNADRIIGIPPSRPKPREPKRPPRRALPAIQRAEPKWTPPPPPENEPASLRVALLDVREGQCRWPQGDPASADFHFCGHPATHGPYCAFHGNVAYRRDQGLAA